MKREFSIGSEWLYYKIYCGVRTADVVLQDYLQEKIAYLIENELIVSWFFIRYNDPESHLRLRFKIAKPEYLGEVVAIFNEVFSLVKEQNLVWKIQTDTYMREIERYGESTYPLSETIFQADSELVLHYVTFKNQFEHDSTPLLFSFLSIDRFLISFSLTLEEKLKLLDRLQTSFKLEFNADKVLKKELDKQYREIEKEIAPFLNQDVTQFEPVYNAVAVKSSAIANAAQVILNDLDVSLSSFLNSHIHMMMNRQFTSRQRQYELLVYDHLFRFYKTMFYKNNR
ncbi:MULTISPECIES: thiopeptide-type bacteriocin biosynthesis protein [Flavobacterium]|uniref:Thiopeptide-type bacteriocin biosynthesis protein n=1 Tax=Flavobacterium jumunjinense TaxID=998845 RepID=A0ABV5GQ68_9FLAO|nr:MULTISPECIES: thiopeptide-type bacteriocin biosynthesis protein [Flavobacterium]